MFCLKVVTFLTLTFLIDKGVRCAFVAIKNYGLKMDPENKWFKASFVVEKVTTDVVVIGSSKASYHYIYPCNTFNFS